MHSKEVLHGSNFQHHPMGGSHRSPCREAFNDQLVWIGHETNERHDTVQSRKHELINNVNPKMSLFNFELRVLCYFLTHCKIIFPCHNYDSWESKVSMQIF